MDLTASTAPRSDQQNFDDYSAGPRTVTITAVTAGTSEQPVNIELAEFPGRPYKPSKSMRRVLIAAWGAEASVYAGRRMRLYGDPTVKFGKDTLGGIKISHLSHIDKPVTVTLTVTRGKRAPHTVEPLPDTPTPSPAAPVVTDEQIAATTNTDDLRGMWGHATAEQQELIKARVAQLNGEAGT